MVRRGRYFKWQGYTVKKPLYISLQQRLVCQTIYLSSQCMMSSNGAATQLLWKPILVSTLSMLRPPPPGRIAACPTPDTLQTGSVYPQCDPHSLLLSPDTPLCLGVPLLCPPTPAPTPHSQVGQSGMSQPPHTHTQYAHHQSIHHKTLLKENPSFYRYLLTSINQVYIYRVSHSGPVTQNPHLKQQDPAKSYIHVTSQ